MYYEIPPRDPLSLITLQRGEKEFKKKRFAVVWRHSQRCSFASIFHSISHDNTEKRVTEKKRRRRMLPCVHVSSFSFVKLITGFT